MTAFPLSMNVIAGSWVFFAIVWLIAGFATKRTIYAGMLVRFGGTALAIGRVGGGVGLGLLFAGFWIKLRAKNN